MSKMTIQIESFSPHCKNTLRGFAAIKIAELHLIINEVGIHTKNGKTWAQPPMRPWVKDGSVVSGDDGKPKYFPVLEFDSVPVRDAFSVAVVRALLEFDPHALDRGAA